MGLAADAGFLVSAEGRMGRVGVIAIGPHPSRLDAAPESIRHVDVAGPYPCAETVQGVVGDFHRLLGRVEGGYRYDGAEDLPLEHAHLVVALEYRRLDVVTPRQI